ncbi:MAG: ABC transporter substrate-binding protein [Spirochaetes bacterium]|nr:ABC transporter substrate-binding protein [Spirochaetota bacterium]
MKKLFKKSILLLTIFVFLFFSFAVFFAGKSGSSSDLNKTTQQNVAIDSLKRNVEIKDYQRVGILNPAVIRNLAIAGYNFKNVIGVDSFTKDTYFNQKYLDPSNFKNSIFAKYNYKELPLKSVEIIGDFNGPNVEKIVSLKIDLLVIDVSFPQKIKDQLDQLKINYFVFSTYNTYDNLKNDINNLYKLFKIDQKAINDINGSIGKLEKDLIELANKFKNKKVLIIVWYDNGFMCAGKDSFLSSFFEKFGFINVINTNGYPVISDETFINLNPDHILVASSYMNVDVLKKDIYKNINAIKKGSIVTIDAEFENKLLQPSKESWEAYKEIFGKLKD